MARWQYCGPCRALPTRQSGSPARVANVDPAPPLTQESPGELVSVSRRDRGRSRISFLDRPNTSNLEIQHALGTRSSRDIRESRRHANTDNRGNCHISSQGNEGALPGDLQSRASEDRERDGPQYHGRGNPEHRRPEETQSGPQIITGAAIPARPPPGPRVRPYNGEFGELLAELRAAAIGWRNIVGTSPVTAVREERARPLPPLVRATRRRPVSTNPGFSRLASRSIRHVVGHRQEPANPLAAPTEPELLSRLENGGVEPQVQLVHARTASHESRRGTPMPFAVSVEPISFTPNASPLTYGSAIRTHSPASSLNQFAQDASVLLQQFSQNHDGTDYINDENRDIFTSAATRIAMIQARLQQTAVCGASGISSQMPINAGADCIICYSNSADTLFIPCKHLVVCGVCIVSNKNGVTWADKLCSAVVVSWG